jgi:hypothetical protein
LWDYRAKNGFYIGPALDSYRCFKLVNANTKSQLILDTVEFCHRYLAVPSPSTEDRIIHGLQVVAGALSGAAPPTSISQVDAIANLWDIFESWHLLMLFIFLLAKYAASLFLADLALMPIFQMPPE